MENIAANFDVELFVTTTKTTTVNVQISAPRYTSAGISESFTVTAGVVKELSFSPLIRMSGTNMDSKGILISADDEVVIYGVNKETYSCDAFLGLPTDVLGKEYLAITYYPPSQQCEILIAAVNDSTSVTVTLGSAIGNSDYVYYDSDYYFSGDSFSLSMDRYDTFQFYSTGDLSGTMIVADKNIAVFSGNKKTKIGSGGSSDHLVEQLTRIDSWGKNFITVPIPLRTVGDYFRFIPSESSTTVTITGGYTETFTITNAGDMVEKEIPSTAYCKITSDKPVLLVQFCLSQQSSGEESDPMMMIIPPIEQFAADYTFATPKYSQGSYNNYFMFVVKESQKDGLRLDGDVFPSTTYNSISGTEYVAGYVAVSHGSHTVRHTSTISIFGGYLYGQANYETYGFTTGMRMAPINTVCVNSTSVVGDGLDNDCDGLIDEELCTSANGGADDDGDGLVDEDCAKPAPVDGNWASWGSFGDCSLTCMDFGSSQTGIEERTRNCTDPAPAYDGAQCVGSGSETQSCTTSTYCAIHGDWGSWAAWGDCSVTCATGVKNRTRECDTPAPQYGGNNCSGDASDQMACTLNPCPVDGGFTDWTSWDTCTVTCGGGPQGRNRSCTQPAPAHGGASCNGTDSETQDCNTAVCIIDGAWGAWGAWGSYCVCTVTCGGGSQSRTRSCDSPLPANGGLQCSGDSSEFQSCNSAVCPSPSPGTYVQNCPSGWFSCENPSTSCIEDAFKCDCEMDCTDGSDESETYAGCSSAVLAACPGGSSSSRSGSGAAEAISRVSVVLMLVCLFVAGRIAI
ncbi:Hemicentin-1 [Mizuhopecten yessoensis]|uniref:Hemicentin-1 n=1 Tax=Mizuhopecten yessoensis TaxID=6573 RepID=A0A210QL70_MIZYE|nr:Hemicentin-1 [Mizuhopecten yessoensis]